MPRKSLSSLEEDRQLSFSELREKPRNPDPDPNLMKTVSADPTIKKILEQFSPYKRDKLISLRHLSTLIFRIELLEHSSATYVINGAKPFISNGQNCGVVIVVARLDCHSLVLSALPSRFTLLPFSLKRSISQP